MADNGTAGAGQPASDRPQTVAGVAESFSDLQRTVRRAKARLLATSGEDIDSATQAVLHTVGARGPMRASALAVCVQSDFSTVSRQAATLVRRGLLERRADQDDGRASLLAVTAAGQAAIDQHERGKQAFFEAVLSGWSDAEMQHFTQQLARFAAAYEHTHTVWMDEWAARQAESSHGANFKNNSANSKNNSANSKNNSESNPEEGPES
jgi:DNA-binding MarR family transcriptional regulator